MIKLLILCAVFAALYAMACRIIGRVLAWAVVKLVRSP
jgi:hypothetical protein